MIFVSIRGLFPPVPSLPVAPPLPTWERKNLLLWQRQRFFSAQSINICNYIATETPLIFCLQSYFTTYDVKFYCGIILVVALCGSINHWSHIS